MSNPTPVVTIETARAIWMAHQQIAHGEKLLADIAETKKQDARRSHLDPPQAGRGYQLGVPSMGMGHQLLAIDPALAEACVRSHIERMRGELAQASLAALVEMGAG
jgi:hypothetical protein